MEPDAKDTSQNDEDDARKEAEQELSAIREWIKTHPIPNFRVLDSKLKILVLKLDNKEKKLHWSKIQEDFDPQIYDCVKYLQENVYDKEKARHIGQHLYEYGNHEAMVVAYRILNVLFYEAPQHPQPLHLLYQIVNSYWNGIGSWLS